MRNQTLLGLVIGTLMSLPATGQDLEILQDDLVLGYSVAEGAASIEIVRGPAEEIGGSFEDNPWIQPFIQALQFDNSNAISHNPEGVLLGLNFGTTPAEGVGGGEIYALPTCVSGQAGQLIGDTMGLGGNGLTLSRLSGLSVSPDNTKVALTGYDSGALILFDYSAGDCTGAGTSLSNARESGTILRQFSTQGSAWLDNDTLMVFQLETGQSTGRLLSIDAETLASQTVSTVETGRPPSSAVANVEFNPLISPYVYVSYGTRADSTTNSLYVFDPRDDFALVKSLDNSESLQTARDIALDSDGNLYFSQFVGTAGDVIVDVLLNVDEPESLQDNQTIDWYFTQDTRTSFSGLDIAVALPIPIVEVDCDFDGDGSLTVADINELTAQSASGENNPAFDLTDDGLVNVDDINEWVHNCFGTWIGDVNLDRFFDPGDLITVAAALTYENDVDAVWDTGDWTGDGRFTPEDLIAAAADLGYEAGEYPGNGGVAAVPEPASLLLTALGSVLLVVARRRAA